MCRDALLAIVLWSLAATPCVAIDLWVTRYDDPVPDGCQPADCSLREAVIAANADPGHDRVLLSSGAYLLTIEGAGENAAATGDLDLLEDVDLVGLGASVTAIRQQAADRVLEARESSTEALVEGVRLEGGSDAGNSLYVSRATVTLDGCETVSPMPGNQGNAAIETVLFATVFLRDSTLLQGGGRGVKCVQSTVEIENSTIFDHVSSEIQATSGCDLSCTHCTIVGTAGQSEVLVSDASTAVTFANTVLQGECLFSSGGGLTSGNGNTETPGDTCSLDQADDVTGAPNSGVEPLGDHGGPTRTMAPSDQSPLIDSAPAAECLAADQRGFDRPHDGDAVPGAECDRGAVEVGEPRPPTPLFIAPFEQGSTAAWSAVVE